MAWKVYASSYKLTNCCFRKQESGVKIMEGLYQYIGKSVHTHFAYVTNLLESIEYLPNVRGQLLHVIIHK
jgi:hypothetical protein